MLPSPMNPMRAMRSSLALRESLKRLDQISNQVGARGCLRDTGERHAVARHDALWVPDEGVDCLLGPDDAAALQSGRIAEVGFPGLAAEHAMQIGSDAFLALLQRVARHALLEPLLAPRGISICERNRRRRQQQSGSQTKALHAAPRGPGFFTYVLIGAAVQ